MCARLSLPCIPLELNEAWWLQRQLCVYRSGSHLISKPTIIIKFMRKKRQLNNMLIRIHLPAQIFWFHGSLKWNESSYKSVSWGFICLLRWVFLNSHFITEIIICWFSIWGWNFFWLGFQRAEFVLGIRPYGKWEATQWRFWDQVQKN